MIWPWVIKGGEGECNEEKTFGNLFLGIWEEEVKRDQIMTYDGRIFWVVWSFI